MGIKKGQLFGQDRGDIIRHPGLFRRHAEASKLTTPQYAAQVLSDPNADPKEKERARLAQTFARMRAKR